MIRQLTYNLELQHELRLRTNLQLSDLQSPKENQQLIMEDGQTAQIMRPTTLRSAGLSP